MADKSYQVVAPYVTLKVKDPAGGTVILGYYAGGVVGAEIDPESLKYHLDSGMLVEVDVDKNGAVSDPDGVEFGPGGAGAPDLDLIGTAGQGSDAGPVGDDSAPAKTDTKDVWIDYAVANGSSREDAEAMTKAELVEKYGA